MKKLNPVSNILFAAIFVTIGGLASCSKDDDTTNNQNVLVAKLDSDQLSIFKKMYIDMMKTPQYQRAKIAKLNFVEKLSGQLIPKFKNIDEATIWYRKNAGVLKFSNEQEFIDMTKEGINANLALIFSNETLFKGMGNMDLQKIKEVTAPEFNDDEIPLATNDCMDNCATDFYIAMAAAYASWQAAVDGAAMTAAQNFTMSGVLDAAVQLWFGNSESEAAGVKAATNFNVCLRGCN